MAGSKGSYRNTVLVCGLGRFGAAAAAGLARMGHPVMAIDHDPEVVREWSGRLSNVIEADCTNLEVLEQLGCGEYDTAVVGVGTSVEANVLTCANLLDLNMDQVWAKALTVPHGKILERLGVQHVTFPDKDAGERIAHLVTGTLMDYIEFDDGFAIVKMRPPMETQGFTLAQAQIRSKYGVTVVGVKSPGQDFTYAQPDTRVSSHDLLLVSGHSELIERFARRP